VAVVASLATPGRQHWGDACGIQQILEETYTLWKGQP